MTTAIDGINAPRVLRTARRRLAVLLAILVVLAAGGLLMAWVTGTEDDERRVGDPAKVSVDELRSVARSAGHAVYWAGRSDDDEYELTETRSGAFHVRYLTAGTAAGDRRPAFLTVSTYPYRRAYAITTASAKRGGMVSKQAPAGGIAAWSTRRPSNVYLAYPGSDFLVEVFSPRPEQARELVVAGDVGPIR
jgi:hypothetical protein